MKKSIVAIVRCNSYREECVFDAVKRGIELAGGIDAVAKAGEKILLKPNVLVGDTARCVSTHPAVFKSVGKLFGEVTDELYYGDSPGIGKPTGQLKKAGLKQAAEELGLKPADFETGRVVSFSGSPFTKRFNIAKGVLESDGIISIAKFKTHQLTRLTGAVKNQFGCIPGLLKAEYHLKMPNVLDFSKMLVALTLFLKPRLYIMDGIMAMEGNGPRSGNPTMMNVLLFSTDPVALDAAACRMINLDPEFVPTSQPGKEWGLGVFAKNEIELVGDPIGEFINKNFRVERKPVIAVTGSGSVSFLKNLIVPRPVIQKENCSYCGICVKICPLNPKALNWTGSGKTQPPEYSYRRCIRCFCCQESCPERAIHVKTPLAGRLFHRNRG